MNEIQTDVAGIEVPVFDAEGGRVTCVCGNGLTLIDHGAAPLIDSDGGPYETYGIWKCRRCRKTWIEDESTGWERWEE